MEPSHNNTSNGNSSSSSSRISISINVEPTADMEPSHNAICEEVPAGPLATQITSIDGFFNRKRGRPPKNRFVEVYKSAQHSPQAIFTSFKLEKHEPTNAGCGLAAATTDSAEERLSAVRLAAGESQTATDLSHAARSRKRARAWTMDAQRAHITPTGSSPVASDRTRNSSAREPREPREQPERVSPVPLLYNASNTQTPAAGKNSERVSVVRAAGTFYPESASLAAEPADSSSCRFSALPLAAQADGSADQPEDLSMRATQTPSSGGRVEPEGGAKLLQFKQLFDLYQRQVLLPSFLAAASQPAALDMRLLLENAAQQKMLLINAAAAGAVAAAAAAAAAAAGTTSQAEESTAAGAAASVATAAPARAGGKRARDQDIPTGYLKFRFNEDCGFERCGYRNHQSHFHCNRRDCHYSFCDKTRFVQHTARHERMDSLMGDDFRQFRANMRCGVPDCCYATPTSETTTSAADDSLTMSLSTPKKSSHFHCRKCDYVCTDSNKVVAHRRLHLRLEYVRSAGFRKIASNEACESPGCTYALRHTHYHCTTCDCSVLSRAQLASHRHRTQAPPAKQLAESVGLDVEACP